MDKLRSMSIRPVWKEDLVQVVVADSLGFCFGVERALEMIHKALNTGQGLSMLGPLIHNRLVLERLEAQGLETVDEVHQVREGALVIRAHGVQQAVYERAKQQGTDLIDATCPFVKRAQRAAQELFDGGYDVILVGDTDHAEVRGIVSAAGGPVNVVTTVKDIDSLELKPRVGLLFQTTQAPELVDTFCRTLVGRCLELRVFNTVCRATADRQDAVRKLAPTVDAMVIVGDPNSANTGRLTAIALTLNVRTTQVETADQLNETFFSNVKNVGLSAGASTPGWLIDEVKTWLEDH